MATVKINPIKSVGSYTNIPAPSSYTWKLQDVSAPDAGRTESGIMYKKKLGQTVAIDLEWKNLKDAEVSRILKAFNSSEYFKVTYLDAMEGAFVTKTFYVGDRSSPLYNSTLGIWSNVSFSIIGRYIKNSQESGAND